MQIISLKLQNFRSFENMQPIKLNKINILTGANNSGKSSIIKAIHALQVNNDDLISDIRLGATKSQIDIEFNSLGEFPAWGLTEQIIGHCKISVDKSNLKIDVSKKNDSSFTVTQITNKEPENLIIPFLSKRKTTTYNNGIGKDVANEINQDMSNLIARQYKLESFGIEGTDPQTYECYKRFTTKILGFTPTHIPYNGGQISGIVMPNFNSLNINQMGDGVANIVFFLTYILTAKNKIFIIEELENDLHPTVLKDLLELIILSSNFNQFIISTHSNIVVRYLASEPNSKLFNVTVNNTNDYPTSVINEVEESIDARLAVLNDLGYSFSDFHLWDGWLFLEESSAESIIRDYLIPFFAQKLSRIKTLAAKGTSKVGPIFEDFNRLVLYTNLEEAYKNKTWVFLDGDDSGKEVISKLKTTYKTWDSSRFQTFNEAQFEYYYPEKFSEQVKKTFEITDQKAKQEAKKILSGEVRAWLNEDLIRGKAALKVSAKEIIEVLRRIEKIMYDK